MDDVYRAEFPAGPYYSTSSVYSYSPTSASDCPEHGTSKKRITCILTSSLIFITVCVLIIAGVSAYLGMLSKNISNNASQAAGEESFLLSESGGRIHSGGGSYTTEENEYIFTTNDDNGGLDALDGVPGEGLVDLSNSLSESSSRGSSTPDMRKTTPTPPARTIEGHYANVHIDAVYRNAIINSNDNMLPSNLVTHRPPPPHEEDNSVRFFTEEASTSSKPFTKLPPRHNRNRQRFPLTNSHSLGPSTTTMVTTTMLEGGDDTTASNNSGGNTHEGKVDHEKHDSEVPHISYTENDKKSGRTDDGGNTVSSSTVANREDLAATVSIDSSTFFSSTESSATTTNRVNNNFDVLGEDQKLSTQALRPISKLRDKDREQEEFTSSSPINGNTKVKQNLSVTSFNVHNVNENDNAMQADGTREDNEDVYNNNRRYHQNHRPDNGQNLLNNKDAVTSSSVEPEMFKPMHPIVSSEREDGMELLNKKDKPLAFDKVSPEYYDNQPWVPLLNRPNLDKRPRVDLDNAHLSSTEPIIVWNSDEPEESVEFPPHLQPGYPNFTEGPIPTMDVIYGHGANFTVSTYYGYGHSGPSSETDVDPHKMNNPNPGSTLNKPVPSHPVQQSNKNNDTRNQTQGLMNGFRPSNIPAYTILIPHIPNPPHASNVSITTPPQDTDTLLSPHLSPPEDYANSYNKLDRMGVAAEEGPTGAEAENADQNGNGKEKAATEKNKKNGDKITYNFEAIKTIPVPQDDDDLKDDDYVDADIDEFTESVQGEPKIYRLDPDSVDLVPDTLGTAQKRPPFSTSSTTSTSTVSSNVETTEGNSGEEADSHTYDDSVEQKENEAKMQNSTSGSLKNKKNGTKDFDKEFSPASMELVIGPQEPDLLVKSTTDLIMSTLGSLNLIKAPPREITEEEINEKLRNSDVHNETETDEFSPTGNKTGSPLFPPVRSYVGVNQPLRPKPNRTESANSNNKQFRFSDEKAEATLNFPPDTTASLQKVLSMMLGGDIGGGEHSRHLANHPLIKGILNKQNVTLIVANETGAPSIISLGDVLPTVLPTMRQTPTTESSVKSTTPVASSSHRDPKSFYTGNRESKIDHAQFTTATDFEHVPVPLMTETPAQPNQPEVPLHLTGFPWSSKPPKASTKVQNNNSPVYKFVLKKGQSVEDLLKEIFLNYTEGDSSVSSNLRESSTGMQQIPVKLDTKAGQGNNNPGFKSLEDMNVEEPSHTESSTTPVRISHHVETTAQLFNAPHPTDLSSMEESSQEVQTSTSVVVHEEMEEHMEDYGCRTNDTFRCVSDGRCIPSYLRCNFIKECDDNSDEEGCLCADFLRANGNDRKLCDGIPDCADASDEYQDCQYCQPGQYICAGTRSCIDKEEVCNSKRDCRFGDDEENCFKLTPEDKRSVLGEIGQKDIASLKDDFSPTYHKKGHLMVRKMGTWGKLCVESFSSVVSHWEVKDLARAVCKALTFADYETVEKVKDLTPNSTEPYYELHYGSSNQTSSGEAHQRPGLGFRQTECKSKLVVNVTCQDLQCGVAPRAYTQRARIVGGANSLPGKWPWQAALYKNGEYQCGATLISSRWLLSAGHCFYHAQDDYWVARLGTLRRGATVLSPYEQVVRITHIFLHPEYKDVGFINDVSLLRLEQEVNFTDFVRPVCLPGKESRIRDGRMCTVVGWGQLFEVGRVFPDTLQEVQLPLISTGECRKRTLFLPLYKLTDEMFCAGFDRGGRDACLGDSGGPLMCPENDGRWSLYGVTSNGYGCARANRPGVYTKVTSYLDWIYDKMSQDSAFTYRDKSKPCEGHRCLLGECLEKRQVCNGIRDCIEDDGSDERGPNCTMNAYLT